MSRIIVAFIFLLLLGSQFINCQSTARVRHHAINFSQLVFIPPSLRSEVPDMIHTRDINTQSRVASLLRNWAERALNQSAMARNDNNNNKKSTKNPRQCDVREARAWVALGHVVGPQSTAYVGDETFNRRSCFLNALSCSNDAANAARTWLGLAMELTQSVGDGFEYKGRKYHKVDALVTALKYDSSLAYAWKDLCQLLPLLLPDQSVEIADRKINRMRCWLKLFALEKENESGNAAAAALTNVCNAMTPGETISLDENYDENDDDDDDHERLTQRDCFKKALRLDSTIASAWWGLASLMSESETIDDVVAAVADNGDDGATAASRVSKRDAIVAALEHGGDALRKNPQVMRALVDSIPDDSKQTTVRIGGETFTKKTAILAALKLNPLSGHLLNELGVVLYRSSSIDADFITNKYCDSARTCFLRAVSVDPDRAVGAFYNLGVLLSANAADTVTIPTASTSQNQEEQEDGGPKRLINSREAFLQSLKLATLIASKNKKSETNFEDEEQFLDPVSAKYRCRALLGLGNTLSPSEFVTFHNGETFNRTALYKLAVKCDPSSSSAWHNLGASLGTKALKDGRPDRSFTVSFGDGDSNKKTMSQFDVFKFAYQLDGNVDALFNLCTLMRADEMVAGLEKDDEKLDKR